MFWPWIVFPLMGALIGYATNYLAVRMLFRPRQPVFMLLFRFQGLIPKRKAEIGERVAEIVSEELVSPERIREAVASSDALAPIHDKLQPRVQAFMDKQLNRLPPMIRAVVPGELVGGMRDAIMKEIVNSLPEMAESVAEQAQKSIDVRAIVKQRMEDLDLNAFERMALRIARKELRAIEILGGFVGFVVGLVQALVMVLMV